MCTLGVEKNVYPPEAFNFLFDLRQPWLMQPQIDCVLGSNMADQPAWWPRYPERLREGRQKANLLLAGQQPLAMVDLAQELWVLRIKRCREKRILKILLDPLLG